jgi:hypothetical protein
MRNTTDSNAEGFYRRLCTKKTAKIHTTLLKVDRVQPKMQLWLKSPNGIIQ